MSLLIGTNIRATLLSTPVITSLVGERVFPLAYLYSQGETVRYPFIIYDGLNIRGRAQRTETSPRPRPSP